MIVEEQYTTRAEALEAAQRMLGLRGLIGKPIVSPVTGGYVARCRVDYIPA